MLKIAWRGVRHNAGRYIATIIAIITGVAFFSASGFLSDRVINALEGDVNAQYSSVDAALVPDKSSDFANDVRISADVADKVAALPGVDGWAGEATGSVAFLRADGTTFGENATGRLWIDDDKLNPIDVKQGVAPKADGEIAVDRKFAEDKKVSLGESLTLLTAFGQFPVKVVGITEFGNAGSIDSNGTISVPSATAFQWLNGGTREYTELWVRGSASHQQLADELKAIAPQGFVAQTGEKFLSDKRDEASSFGRVLKTGLQAFSTLALIVGGFVIFNTFSVIVAQRLRELAVMSAIGATPKQIKRSLRFEGLVIGLIGSALGVVAGFALTFGLIAVLQAFGIDLPGSGLKVTPSVVIQGMVAGTLITFMSVMIPARRAARTEPIEAMRQTAVESGKISRKRIIAVIVLAALGVMGLLSKQGAGVGFGAFALFLGTILAGPILAKFSAKLFRPLAARFGLEGRLAADNTARNPQRTATTANALLIGVYLVTLITVAGTSLKDYAVAQINKLAGADFMLGTTGGTIDDALVAKIKTVKGVVDVVTFTREPVTLDGKPSAISTGDFTAMQKVASLKIKDGSFAALGDGGIIVAAGSVTGSTKHQVGDTVKVVNKDGKETELKVVGTTDDSLDAGLTGSFVSPSTFVQIAGEQPPNNAFMDAENGMQSEVEDGVKQILKLRPDVNLTQGSSIGKIIGQIFDFLINAVNGLLMMSVAVALIGIVNTMSLSILERRRELGLLRVVGMIDKRVRRMVRIESVLISGLGTVTGIVVGTATGWGIVNAISASAEGISFSMPWLLLVAVLALGVLLGYVAALIPARRSTRLEVLEAIQAV